MSGCALGIVLGLRATLWVTAAGLALAAVVQLIFLARLRRSGEVGRQDPMAASGAAIG